MLERVLRRFGVRQKDLRRRPTYFEELLGETRSRVIDSLGEDPHRNPIDVVISQFVIIEAEKRHVEPPNLDDESVFGAVQAYFSLISANDQLPPSSQLNARELRLVRKLLLSAAHEIDGAPDHSERVLSLLEEKFNGGNFTQAAILLRLFETTSSRERNNERTLFYEEMFSRFGAVRTNRIPKSLCEKYREAMKAEEDPLTRIAGASAWLAKHANVHLNVFFRQPTEVSEWREVVNGSSLEIYRSPALTMLPPARWRDVQEFAEDGLESQLALRFGRRAVVAYVTNLLKTCYFIVLVTGKTGYESFIKHYFRWVSTHFDLPPTRLLPDLHRRTTIGEESLKGGLEGVIEDLMEDGIDSLVEQLDDECIRSSIAQIAEDLEKLDPNDIPPGEYDLMGLLIDRATGMTGEDPTMQYRIHRLC